VPVAYSQLGYGSPAAPASITGYSSGFTINPGGPLNLAVGASYVFLNNGVIMTSTLAIGVDFQISVDGVVWWFSYYGANAPSPIIVISAGNTRIINGSGGPISIYYVGWGLT